MLYSLCVSHSVCLVVAIFNKRGWPTDMYSSLVLFCFPASLPLLLVSSDRKSFFLAKDEQ